ncbi:MAG: hypothetical protein QOE14_888 [Humisphaera sp.]|nr:hypothetical protein [Humisphaera sp.]
MTTLSRTISAIERGIDQGLHLGAQVYVSLRGETVADIGVGEASPGAAMTADTINLWMSAVKPVTAVAVARLWESGKLDLDDRVVKYVPEFAAGGKEAITVRHLLTHTAGFRGAAVSWTASWEENLAKVHAARLEPNWVPGETAGYHVHTAWYTLGELIERIGGRAYDQFVHEEIFRPIGIRDAWVRMSPEDYRANLDRIATVYNTSKGPPDPNTPKSSETECTAQRPSGNGRGPIRELARFYEMMLNRGERTGVRIISPQSAEALVARHRVGLLDKTFNAKIDWGLGFIIDSKHYEQPHLPYGYGPHASRRTYGHSGYECSCAFADPEHQLVVAWVCNGMPGDAKHQQRQSEINTAIYEDVGVA